MDKSEIRKKTKQIRADLNKILKSPMTEIRIEDLQAFYECALRYALGRRTYITMVISEGIMNLPDGVIDARSRQVMLRDLERYFEDRLDGRIRDDDCDYENWKELYDYLLEEI